MMIRIYRSNLFTNTHNEQKMSINVIQLFHLHDHDQALALGGRSLEERTKGRTLKHEKFELTH